MRPRPRTLLTALALAAAVTGAGAAAASAAADPDNDVTIGVLDTPATAEDKLPSWFTGTQAVEHMKLASARYVDAVGERRYFLLDGADAALTCLVYVTQAQESAGTCADTQEALTKGIYLMQTTSEDTAITAVVVPDGYDGANTDASDRVVGDGQNFTALQGQIPTSITLTAGPETPKAVTIDVGPATPQ